MLGMIVCRMNLSRSSGVKIISHLSIEAQVPCFSSFCLPCKADRLQKRRYITCTFLKEFEAPSWLHLTSPLYPFSAFRSVFSEARRKYNSRCTPSTTEKEIASESRWGRATETMREKEGKNAKEISAATRRVYNQVDS